MSLLPRKSKNGEHFIAVFDIGSGSIGGAFVSIAPNKNPEIIFATRRDIPFQEKLNFQRFLETMVKTLEEMFAAMQKAGGGIKIEQAFCVLASPWYASQTRLIRYNQPEPFVVTEKGLNKIIQKEIELFRDSKLFARSKVANTAPEIMESKNIQIKLNGYEVRNPYGKRVSELEIALYISMIPANIFKSINESIMKFWHVSDVHFSSFAFTAFDTIRDAFVDESSFMFMDISSEVSDISLARDNVLLESISFPAGKNLLIRALVSGMKTTPAAAISELNLYLENKSTKEHAKQIEEILGKATAQWTQFFQDAIAQFATEFPIPRTIFYTTDDNVTKWFEQAIVNASLEKNTPDENTFMIRSLGNSFLNKFVQVLEPDFKDPFIAIETIFANKFTGINSRTK